jgi:hypothetical protein
MKTQKRNRLWKLWKNKLRFPTVPTAPTAANIKMKKQRPKKNYDRLHKILDATIGSADPSLTA